MADFEKRVEAGHAVYTKWTLAAYDVWVHGLSNRFIWKCPTRRILELYDHHVTGNHLEVGVGTGYFLNRCRFPSDAPRVTLMDLNEDCLGVTARRISRYKPEILHRNVLQPIEYNGDPFDSVGINYVLHCLPGTITEKAVVFEHLKLLMRSGGVVFGATLLSKHVERGLIARRLMDIYNRKGIFSNTEDSLDDLKQVLSGHFSESAVATAGCAALFWGRV